MILLEKSGGKKQGPYESFSKKKKKKKKKKIFFFFHLELLGEGK